MSFKSAILLILATLAAGTISSVLTLRVVQREQSTETNSESKTSDAISEFFADAEKAGLTLQQNGEPKAQAPSPEATEACGKRAKALCGNLDFGTGLGACIAANLKKLGPECEHFARSTQEELDVCKTDIRRYCPSAPVGGGRIVRCLLTQRTNLNLKCREWVEQKAESMNL